MAKTDNILAGQVATTDVGSTACASHGKVRLGGQNVFRLLTLVTICAVSLFVAVPAMAYDGAATTTTTSDSTKEANCNGLDQKLVDTMVRAALEASAKTHETINAAATGDIKKRYCVGDKLQWMQWSSVQTMILGMIQAIISSTIQQVLDYVCAEEQAIVNNMLAKFCVPMPTFGNINLGLKADGMEACNGTALLTLTTSTGVTVSPLPFPTAVTSFFKNLNTTGAK